MSDSTDYEAVSIPDGKPREDYSCVERRAEILERIEWAGHPGALNKSELARQYGVSHTSIGRDFEALAEYVAAHLDRDHSFIMDRVLRAAVRNLVEHGELLIICRVVARCELQSDRPRSTQAGWNTDPIAQQMACICDDPDFGEIQELVFFNTGQAANQECSPDHHHLPPYRCDTTTDLSRGIPRGQSYTARRSRAYCEIPTNQRQSQSSRGYMTRKSISGSPTEAFYSITPIAS